jgi:hypothetical protein
VGEGDHVHLADADARQAKAEPDRLVGEALGVPLAVEPLLLGQGHQPPVLQQARRRVMAEAVDPKDPHPDPSSPGPLPDSTTIRMIWWIDVQRRPKPGAHASPKVGEELVLRDRQEGPAGGGYQRNTPVWPSE